MPSLLILRSVCTFLLFSIENRIQHLPHVHSPSLPEPVPLFIEFIWTPENWWRTGNRGEKKPENSTINAMRKCAHQMKTVLGNSEKQLPNPNGTNRLYRVPSFLCSFFLFLSHSIALFVSLLLHEWLAAQVHSKIRQISWKSPAMAVAAHTKNGYVSIESGNKRLNRFIWL